ncbi:MAG TPA: ferredoxin reductase [Candidatus Aquilonibacter sp.]
MTWRVATVVERRDETATARTLVLDAVGWPGHDAGQYCDVRLTAPDGYTAVRSYSIANAAAGSRIELTIEDIAQGEVSPYLVETAMPGDTIEVRGPIGGWFVWRPEQLEPVQLVAGGSGVVPLMAMIRARRDARSIAPFRLLYSVRSPHAVIYERELLQSAADGEIALTLAYTREIPSGWTRTAARIDGPLVMQAVVDASLQPSCYVCGPAAFVEHAAALLIAAGHDPARIKTERFGPSAP